MLSSQQEEEPVQGSCAGYPASVHRGDDGSKWAGCPVPGAATVWRLSPALAEPVRPAASWGRSSVPFEVHFPSTAQTAAS